MFKRFHLPPLPRLTRRTSRLGQTIVEIIVATGVVALVMTSVVAVISVSVRNTARAKSKLLATKYTQEGIEYFRAQRKSMGWETFYAAAQQGGAGATICLDELPYTANGGFNTIPRGECDEDETVDPKELYQRTAQLTTGTSGNGQFVRVTVTVTWNDSGSQQSSNATAELRPN